MAYELPAEVNFANLVHLREQGKQHIDGVDVAEFDLSGLQGAGSAVVALLIAGTALVFSVAGGVALFGLIFFLIFARGEELFD